MTDAPSPGDPLTGCPSGTAILKAALRAEALARRDRLDAPERAEASAAIGRHVLALAGGAALPVSAYLPIRSEVDLTGCILALDARGHPVGLPVIRPGGLVFRRFRPGAPLVPLGFGTRGPGPEAEEVIPELMLIPLAAFDRGGGRIGYGGGYYDRTIAALRSAGRTPRLIGVAFSVQEIGSVPLEPHDVRLDGVVTEAGYLSIP